MTIKVLDTPTGRTNVQACLAFTFGKYVGEHWTPKRGQVLPCSEGFTSICHAATIAYEKKNWKGVMDIASYHELKNVDDSVVRKLVRDYKSIAPKFGRDVEVFTASLAGFLVGARHLQTFLIQDDDSVRDACYRAILAIHGNIYENVTTLQLKTAYVLAREFKHGWDIHGLWPIINSRNTESIKTSRLRDLVGLIDPDFTESFRPNKDGNILYVSLTPVLCWYIRPDGYVLATLRATDNERSYTVASIGTYPGTDATFSNYTIRATRKLTDEENKTLIRFTRALRGKELPLEVRYDSA